VEAAWKVWTMTVRFTDEQITEAEIEIACEIACSVLDFLKQAQERAIHEAIASRIERAMRRKAAPKEVTP
jgi:glutathionylspermidine synthase